MSITRLCLTALRNLFGFLGGRAHAYCFALPLHVVRKHTDRSMLRSLSEFILWVDMFQKARKLSSDSAHAKMQTSFYDHPVLLTYKPICLRYTTALRVVDAKHHQVG
jgi:hypothetical protein